MRFKEKIALITGAARGIGKEIALLFAKEGARLAICDVNIEEANNTKKELEAQGTDVLALQVDVTDFEKVQDMVNKILDKFKRIDILVNNAGITKDNLILRMSEAEWDAVIKVNLKGAFNCIKAVSKAMVKQRSGKIINISSIIGLTGNPGQANYSASKAGLIALTKTAAKELSSRNINVNAIAPGFISTEMTRSLPEELRKKMLAEIPLGRFGLPADVAGACLFLASGDAAYITGHTMIVDGGMLMQ